MKPRSMDLFILGPSTGVASEVLDLVAKHGNQIYVRDIKDGVRGSYRLTDLPASQMLTHILRWVRERQHKLEAND